MVSGTFGTATADAKGKGKGKVSLVVTIPDTQTVVAMVDGAAVASKAIRVVR